MTPGTVLALCVASVAFISAVLISLRAKAHAPITVAFGVTLLHVVLAAREVEVRVQLAAHAGIALCTVYAYLARWAPRERRLVPFWIVFIIAPFREPLTETSWLILTWLPLGLATAAGGVAWAHAQRSRHITEIVLTVLLLTDMTGLVLATLDVSAYQGRVQFVIVSGIQIAYLVLRRSAAAETQP